MALMFRREIFFNPIALSTYVLGVLAGAVFGPDVGTMALGGAVFFWALLSADLLWGE